MAAKPKTPNNDVNDLNLRDIFADFAMCGMIASPKDVNSSGEGNVKTLTDFAKVAYVMADAMIEERQNNER